MFIGMFLGWQETLKFELTDDAHQMTYVDKTEYHGKIF